MLSKLIEISLRNRLIVLLLTGVLVVVGIISFRELPFDAYPDTTPVQVTVNTVAPSLSPLEVERQLTFPLEQAIGGLPGLEEVRSVSKFGFSQITVIFDDDVDIYLGRQVVTERIQTVELPEDASKPALGPVATGLGEVFQYVVKSDERSTQELRTIHEWTVRPQMLTTPGVAEINTWGGYEKQFHVVIDLGQLIKHDLTIEDVELALKRNNANVGGGVVGGGGESQIVQGIGLARNLDDIERIVVAAVDGVPIRVSDVARVEEGSEIRRGAVTANGEGEVVLGLGFMLMGENSREVTAGLEKRLEEAQASVPDDVELEPMYSRTELVDNVLETVRNNLLEGALLVIAILFMMLGSWRAGLIVALAIPLSMLFAFNMMLQFGIVGSLMSLGAIDFGLVVDSSVIIVENAERRLAEDTSGRSVVEIVRDAAVEVRKPTLFGELIIAIVYLPILALEGVEGKLFQPMALTVIFALLGSMIISMTLMPVLASYALQRRANSDEPHRDIWLVRGLKRLYRPVLDWALNNRKWVLLFAAGAVLNAGVLAAGLGSQFVPRLRENSIVINTVRLAGVSLDESVRYGTQLEKRLLQEFPDEIEDVWTRTGTGEVATDPMGLELSDVFITLHPRDQWKKAETKDELVEKMQGDLEGMPGMRTIFTQPIEMRVNEMLAGIRADVGVKLYGDDFDVLEEKSGEIQTAVEALPNATDVTTEQMTGLPVLQIELDRDKLARYGIAAENVLRYVDALGTRKVGEIREGQRRFDLVVRLSEEYRDNPESIESILITSADGQRVPLGQLADIDVVESPATINREWSKRRVIVQANVADGDIGGFVRDVREAIDRDVELPPGYYVDYGGQYENLQRAQSRLLLVVPIALLLIFTLLYLTYGRFLDTIRVFTGVPFAAIGGILALWIRDMPFSISAGVGFVALSGIAVLGDMVLVSYVRDLLDRGMEPLRAIREGAMTRMRPVLMTGLVAALGFIPMALNTGVGAQVQRPLATVVIGGIVTSTIATLVVMPVLYAVFGTGE
ncbi:MAG: efflux RND transporter permease subunit [Myxococcota bacterium]